MPLKREVVALLSSRDDWTRVSGAANTLLLDAEGGQARTEHRHPGSAGGDQHRHRGPDQVGGRARRWCHAASVLLALAERGLERATLVVRDPARATETLAAVARHPRPPQVTVTALEDLEPASADILVSTVPVEAQTESVTTAAR